MGLLLPATFEPNRCQGRLCRCLQISIFGEIWSFSLLLLSQPAKRVKNNVQHQFNAAYCYRFRMWRGLPVSVGPMCQSVGHDRDPAKTENRSICCLGVDS